MLAAEGERARLALGVDVRTGSFLTDAAAVLDDLTAQGHDIELVFLDCSDEVLVHRFSETRRPHALAPDGDVLEGIGRERERIAELRARARHVVDTTDMSVHDLRRAIVGHIARGGPGRSMTVRIVSFGFKHGAPVNADLVFDLRFLKNPHFVPELRPKTGIDPAVSAYVLEQEDTQRLLEHLVPMLSFLLPRYAEEGKAYLTIGIGCTGGRHRSVAVSEELATKLRTTYRGGDLVVAHRDKDRVKRT